MCNSSLKCFLKFSFLFSLLISISGCNWFSKVESKPEFLLLNVNDKESFDDARIANSINMSYDQLEDVSKAWNKDNNIVIYCTDYACTESSRVAKKLKQLGFNNVQAYKGGIQEWYQLSLMDKEAYPFEGNATQGFLKNEIIKLESDEQDIKIINAQDLSKLIKEKRK